MDSKESIIFIDHNSTTPVDPNVLDAMLPFYSQNFGNPSSSNSHGKIAKKAVLKSRCSVAELINSRPEEVIFTSGATESINMAIKGFLQHSRRKKGNHIISVKTEHKAVLDTLAGLESQGFEVTLLNVDNNGFINLDDFKKAIRVDTVLCSIMHVNNEIGTINALKSIAKICRNNNVILFSDAAQSVGKIKVDVKDLGVDMLSISAHKMYGPKGVGALYINKDNDLNLMPMIEGGGQENGYRSGTLNVPGIVGFGKAAQILYNRIDQEISHIKELRNIFINSLKNEINFKVNGSLEHRIPGNLNITINGVESMWLMMKLSNQISLSNGSACNAFSIEPSHVLMSLGLTQKQIDSTLRICFGRFNNKSEILKAADIIKKYVKEFKFNNQKLEKQEIE